MWVQSLGREDPLEKEMATHSSTLAWKIPWMEESCRLQSMGSKELDVTEQLHFTLDIFRRIEVSSPPPFFTQSLSVLFADTVAIRRCGPSQYQ